MHFTKKTVSEKRSDLIKNLKSKKLLRFPGAYNPLCAKLIVEIGFDGVYVSGGVMSNDLGLPDIGLTCFGLANLFLLYPQVQFYMKILCFIYLVYLGWKMIGSFSMVQKETGRPLRFYEASLFQFINPKAWSIAVTVASGFFPTDENIFIGVAFVTITAAAICFPTISLWALFGSGLRRFVTDIKIKKIIEYLLAVLLVLTGLFILLK